MAGNDKEKKRGYYEELLFGDILKDFEEAMKEWEAFFGKHMVSLVNT